MKKIQKKFDSSNFWWGMTIGITTNLIAAGIWKYFENKSNKNKLLQEQS